MITGRGIIFLLVLEPLFLKVWIVEILYLIGFVLIAAAIIGINLYLAKKRREAFQAIADAYGFTFNPEKDYGLARSLGFLNDMDDGHKRYCCNVLRGELDGQKARIFDYHYETYSRDSKGRRTTNHHWFSIFTLELPKAFPELVIKPEGIFAKIGQALGFDDIDFESVDFSKRYNVRSKDKKFAYDFCNAQMITYLLKQDNLVIEVDRSCLALTFTGKLAVDRIPANIERLQKIRGLIPNYLFNE